jgi:hypothetical protein
VWIASPANLDARLKRGDGAARADQAEVQRLRRGPAAHEFVMDIGPHDQARRRRPQAFKQAMGARHRELMDAATGVVEALPFGALPTQTSIIYNLFNGAGSIERRPDRWLGAFRGLISEKDNEIVLRCLQTVSAAIEKTSDRMAPSRSVLTVASWYRCDISTERVSNLLGKYWMQGKELKLGFLNAEKIRIDLNPVLENTKEGWSATFYVAASQVDTAQLFMNYIGTYISGGLYNSVDRQAAHARSMLVGMLNEFGFETPSET